MKRKMLSMLMALAMILSLLPVTALAADGKACAGGEDCTHVAAIGDVHYDTLAEAVDAVADGQTIDLLRTAEGGGVKVEGTSGRTFTIDLHGFTYTVVNPTVGSTGTETNGFQLLKGSTVTFKNGTIKPGTDAAKILFQNYCNLTLENVTVDCTGSNCQYVASNNCGNVVIKDSTLLAASNQAAFDLYYWPDNGYAEGVTVTVEGDSVISGRVVYGSDGTPDGLANVAEKAVLTINSGAFTGSFYTYNLGSNKANIVINGGTFSTDVSAYTGEDVACTDNGDGTYTVESLNAKNAVAEVNGSYYKTLPAAISRAQDGETVKLLKDTSYNAQISVLKNIKLDLGGNTFSSGAAYSIVVAPGKALTIQNGTIKSNGTALFGLKSSTITVEKDAVIDAVDGIVATNNKVDEGNAVINVYGTINSTDIAVWCQGPKNTVNLDGATITANYFAVYQNGSFGGATYTIKNSKIYNGEDAGPAIYISNNKTNAENPQQGWQTLIVENSSITGSAGIEVKYTNVTLTDCTIVATADEPTFDQYNNGSTTAGFAVVASDNTMQPNDPKPEGTVVINGGYYTGLVGLGSLIDMDEYPDFKETTYTISSGYFTSDPSAYAADGYAALPSDNSAYAYMVGAAAETDVEPAVGAPDVTMGDQIKAEDRETVKDAAESVTTSGELAAAANQAIGQVTEQQKDDAEAAIKADDSGVTVGEGDTITIYAQTYLDITPTAYDKDKSVLTLDITPMYRVVASTADTAAGIDLEGADKNAVVLKGSEKALTGIQNMTISIMLPADFPTDHLYVKHTKDGAFVGYHKATVDSDANTLTFTNDKGFSTFEIMADDRTATVNFGGEIGRITYTPANVGDTLPTPAAPAGQAFGGWTFQGIEGTYTTLTDELLTALSGVTSPIAATAKFYTPSSGTSYAITVADSDNGTVTASRTRANKGLTVTLTVKADEGYKLDTITVTDKNGNEIKLTDKGDGKYTFTMPASAVTVKASFAKDDTPVETGLPFTDVKADDWFFEAVKYVYDNKLMDGTSSTTFAPLMTTNRAMIVTILWRLEGSPVVNYAMNFSDVESGVWYTEAVRWAAAEGIVKGYSDTVFAPDDTVTREQLATILYRYAGYKEYDVSAKGDLTTFADGSTVSTWAADGMTWAAGAQLITGKDGGKLDPTGTATRAEVATILMRFCENVAK